MLAKIIMDEVTRRFVKLWCCKIHVIAKTFIRRHSSNHPRTNNFCFRLHKIAARESFICGWHIEQESERLTWSDQQSGWVDWNQQVSRCNENENDYVHGKLCLPFPCNFRGIFCKTEEREFFFFFFFFYSTSKFSISISVKRFMIYL